MTRVHGPCRHQLSTFAPVREEDEAFLDFTADEARALAMLVASRPDPGLRAVTDQLARELATLEDVRTRPRP